MARLSSEKTPWCSTFLEAIDRVVGTRYTVALQLERRGIDAVPRSLRTQDWFGMFAMYAGINICLPMMMVGGLFVPGMSFRDAVVVAFLANAIGFSFTALSAYPGIEHGLPTLVLTRMSLGYPLGTRIPSLAVLMSLTGWFAVQAELAGLAADGMMVQLVGVSSPLAMIALMGAANVFFAVMGYGWMRKLAGYAVPVMLVLTAWLFIELVRKVPFWELVNRPGDGTMSFLAGMNLMISAQVSGSFTASDISRYAKSHRSVWVGIFGGVTPVAAFMIALGALSALATGEWNPVLGVQHLGLGMGSLFLIIFATWTTNDKNLYSGGLALTNLFPGKARWIHTLALGAVGTTVACMRLTQYFSEWLILLGVVFAPLLAIVLTDHFFVRHRELPASGVPDAERLNRKARSVNRPALVAIALGVVAGRWTPPEMIQPVVSMVVTGVVYVAGMRWSRRPV